MPVALAVVALPSLTATGDEPAVLFETGFEPAEGYNAASPLRGQAGWQGEGSGGNGLVVDFFEGWGQQAFIGYAAPAPKDESLSLWRPLGLPAPDPAQPVWKFSTWMQVVDSTNGEYDDFRWSAYNTEGVRLFTLNFDNASLDITYALEGDAAFQPSGFTFSGDVIYLLEIWMNFARNNWQAVLNGQVVVDAQPITTTWARLDLGDLGPVWTLRTKGAAGDNYLLFDDYRITREAVTSIPTTIELVGFNARGEFELYVHSERGRTFSLDVSADLREWVSLGTNRLDDGWWFFTDTTAPDYPVSFYRAREVLSP